MQELVSLLLRLRETTRFKMRRIVHLVVQLWIEKVGEKGRELFMPDDISLLLGQRHIGPSTVLNVNFLSLSRG